MLQIFKDRVIIKRCYNNKQYNNNNIYALTCKQQNTKKIKKIKQIKKQRIFQLFALRRSLKVNYKSFAISKILFAYHD